MALTERTGVRGGRAGVNGGEAADGEKAPPGPPAPDYESRTSGAGGNPDAPEGRAPTTRPAPAPGPDPAPAPERNALQALCRQVFGFRLAMIALAAPAALLNAAPGWGTRLVGAAVVVTFMASYALFRDWERFGPLLLRHPTLLAVDTLFGSLLLISAGPDTTLAYVSVCTPLLAGIVYSWRGAACFASLQSLILLLVHATARDLHANPAEALLLPGLCVVTGALGSTLRNLLLRFGAATQALAEARSRLAAREAADAERAHLAREMHDSVAKTLHGVALAADGLAVSARRPRTDPAVVGRQAELIARAARRAATEARALLTDLRREQAGDLDFLGELASRTQEFTTRTGIRADYSAPPAAVPLDPAATHQLLKIAEEALENAHRHADPTRIEVRAALHDDHLRMTIQDDGRGLPPGTALEHLRTGGHFGLLGMAERATSIGARFHIGHGDRARGTLISVELPVDRPREAAR
ncbi:MULTISPECIES: sensor histidine kinase [unclassified Streptomyces]|uniref:sensor histidine kinase n=1 Tax=unclassified Streptomyces TaxID=2593676 RepID=UPI0036F79FE5